MYECMLLSLNAYMLCAGAASMTKPRTSAQLINHPPAGTQPNVFNTDFSWAEYVQYVQEQKLVGAGEVDKEMDIIEQVNFGFNYVTCKCNLHCVLHMWWVVRKVCVLCKWFGMCGSALCCSP